jgi:uncharacterized protein (TIGR03083 family)
MDYLDHLVRDSARFAEALHGVPAERRVPTCPDWNADDLLWHLAEVQWFWGTVVRGGLTGPEAEKLKPERPAGREPLEAFFQEVSGRLVDALRDSAPDAPAWTWSTEQTAGFIRRRQAHEALIHRLDAELLTGERTPMDQSLSTDGVDEVLRIMYGGAPPWGRFTPEPESTVRIRAVDSGASWLVTLGRFSGTDPDDGRSYADEPDLRAAESDSGEDAAATISGRAEDLDCWLWHRPPVQSLARSGDQEVLGQFDAIITPGIN